MTGHRTQLRADTADGNSRPGAGPGRARTPARIASPALQPGPWSRGRAAIVRAAKTLTLLTVLAGTPWALATQVPIPVGTLIDHVFSAGSGTAGDGSPGSGGGIAGAGHRVLHLLGQPVTDTLVLQLLAAALWLLWIAFLACVITEAVALAAGVRAPRLPGLGLVQGVASWLLTGTAAGMLAAASFTLPPDARTAGAAPGTTSTAMVFAEAVSLPAAATGVVADPKLTYQVEPGDWLGGIAERFLGRFDAYPILREANASLIPEATGSRGPDHIEPGWILTLPPGARDRGSRLHATGTLRQSTAHTTGHTPDTGQDSGTGNTTGTGTGTGGTTGPGTTGPRSSGPATTAGPTEGSTATTQGLGEGPTGQPQDRSGHDRDSADDGIRIPGGWIGLPLAAALLALAGMVRLQRRRRIRYNRPSRQDRPRHRFEADPEGDLDPDAFEDDAFDAGDLDVPDLDDELIGFDDLDDPPPPANAVITRIRRAVHAHASGLPAFLDDPFADDPFSGDLDEPADLAGHAPGTSPGSSHSPATTGVRPPHLRLVPGDVPELPPLGPGTGLAGLPEIPPEGLGLHGPGALDAARGLLIAALSAGGPADPDASGHVVATTGVLTTLLGEPGPLTAAGIPRLHIGASLDEAITLLDQHILERRRTLDDHDADNAAALRSSDPYSAPMPPMLLLAEAPPPAGRARLSTTLHLGAPVQINAVLLGDWPRGQTLTITADGTIAQPPGPSGGPAETMPGAGSPQRVALLDRDTTSQLLQVIAEAHTGYPATASSSPPAPGARDGKALPGPEPSADADPGGPPPASRNGMPLKETRETTPQAKAEAATGTEQPSSGAGEPDAEATGGPRVQVRLLGQPEFLDRNGEPLPRLRSNAAQLLAFLVFHRDGEKLPDILEAMYPDALLRKAAERLSTEAGNLRSAIRRGIGDPGVQPVINSGGHYRLNPACTDADLWRFWGHLSAASAATSPDDKAAHLRSALDEHHGGVFAEGRAYEWVDRARESVQRQATLALLTLSELASAQDPHQAAALAVEAADLEPINEDVARRAIRALAAIGDTDGIRRRSRVLRQALDEIGYEPSERTLALIAEVTAVTRSTPPSGLSAEGTP